MDLRDIIIAPIFLTIIIITTYAYSIQNKQTFSGKKYFVPALSIKLFSGIMIGLIYTFYYEGGDTFAYFNQGKIISKVLSENFGLGLRILFSNGEVDPYTYKYTSLIYYYQFKPEFLIVKIAGLFCFLGFNSYSVVAIYFGLFSFSGLWAMYKAWVSIQPNMEKLFAIALFFIPSVFFWGSGILKDSITLGATGWLFSSFCNIAVFPNKIIKNLIIAIVCIYLIYIIKIYILLAFLPPFVFWIFLIQNRKIQNHTARKLLLPLFVLLGVTASFFLFNNITQGNEKYNLDSIGQRAKISADWLYYVSVKEGGSAYYLGELDGSIESMIRLAPNALFVTLFRPFIWESKNPLMLISALEVFMITIFFIITIIKIGLFNAFKKTFSDPFIFLCFSFSVIMAIGVGLTTFNFGTLVRYKIPLLPFYFAYISTLWKSHRKVL